MVATIVAKFAVPVAVILVPVALSKNKLEMYPVIALNIFANRFVEVAFVFTRFVLKIFVSVAVAEVTESKTGLEVNE